jgi:hypothetical protein
MPAGRAPFPRVQGRAEHSSSVWGHRWNSPACKALSRRSTYSASVAWGREVALGARGTVDSAWQASRCRDEARWAGLAGRPCFLPNRRRGLQLQECPAGARVVTWLPVACDRLRLAISGSFGFSVRGVHSPVRSCAEPLAMAERRGLSLPWRRRARIMPSRQSQLMGAPRAGEETLSVVHVWYLSPAAIDDLGRFVLL